MMLCGRWGGQSGSVFSALEGDFMKPRIDEVQPVDDMRIEHYTYVAIVIFFSLIQFWMFCRWISF